MIESHQERGRRAGMATRGEAKGTAKLTTSDVIAIRMSTEPSRVVAQQLGVNERHVRAIRQRTWWKHVP